MALHQWRAMPGAIRRLHGSPLFSAAYYQASAPSGWHLAPLAHFLVDGWRRNLDPSPFFSVRHYLERYDDVRVSGANPLLHYIVFGWREGRAPHPGFDVTAYKARHPKVDFRLVDPLRHSIEFDPEWCRTVFRTAGFKRSERRRVRQSGLFDPAFYASFHPDVAASGADPLTHYLRHGWLENRNPSLEFDNAFYAATNPEVIARRICPLVHYIDTGAAQGRKTKASNQVTLQLGSSAGSLVLPRLGVHVHCFYPDLFEEVAIGLRNLPRPLDLLVTVCTEPDRNVILAQAARLLPDIAPAVIVVPNRGRDLAPLFVAARPLWARNDVVLHLHTKRSPHTPFGDAWRHYLFDMLIGSRALVDAALARFAADEGLGILYPANFFAIQEFVAWGVTKPAILRLMSSLGLAVDDLPEPAQFAAGSMAFTRTAALKPLLDHPWAFEAFGDEHRQLDDTLAHVLERAMPVVAAALGYRSDPYLTSRRPRLDGQTTAPPRGSYHDVVGHRWTRDTPRIAVNRPQSVAPRRQTYDPAHLEIQWVIPDFGRGAGGHMTIFRIVEFLAKFGHRQTIWIQNARNQAGPAAAKARIAEWYRPIGDTVHVRFLPDDVTQLSGDILIATDAWTAYPVAAARNVKARFYFIQDFEAAFHPMGDIYLTVEDTYRFGFNALCAGKWLLAKAQGYGMWARGWDLASDPAFYFPPTCRRRDPTRGRLFRVAFYARPYTPRRAVELGVQALTILHRRGVRFVAYLFGEDHIAIDGAFPHRKLGVQPPEKLGALYRAVDIGLVFSTTNYSLVPLEMMACDCPVVEMAGESTQAVFGKGEVTLSGPDPVSIADAIEELAFDASRRARQRDQARAFVERVDWESSARLIEDALRDRLRAGGFAAVDPVAVCAPALHNPRVGAVVIPTFNAGPGLRGVLDRLVSQKTDEPFDMLVIDSGSTDETVETVQSFRGKGVRLHEIANKEFQHGRTRNLGVTLTEAPYVAFLTQDALPESDGWLQHLLDGFGRGDRVAGVTGRHRAYREHGPFIRRDLDVMFDALADLPSVYALDIGLPSFIYPGGLEWRMLMHFYSDNNSALSRAVWRVMPYPEIDWGEDQAWAWEMLGAGFQKVYADKAVVIHSHSMRPAKQRALSEVEGRFFKEIFGYELYGNDVGAHIAAQRQADASFARTAGISDEDLKRRHLAQRATIKGRVRGAKTAWLGRTDDADHRRIAAAALREPTALT